MITLASSIDCVLTSVTNIISVENWGNLWKFDKISVAFYPTVRYNYVNKFRDDITHGNLFEMGFDLARTYIALIVVYYICILRRIGLPEDKIKLLIDTLKECDNAIFCLFCYILLPYSPTTPAQNPHSTQRE
jgi:hypothetical protein